jgi:hypothetical protein
MAYDVFSVSMSVLFIHISIRHTSIKCFLVCTVSCNTNSLNIHSYRTSIILTYMKPRKSKYICKFTSNTVHCGKMWYITQNTALIEAHACDKSVLNMVVIQRDMRKIKVLSFCPEDGDNFFLRNVDIYLWVQAASQPRTTSSSSAPWHPHRLMRAITYDSQIGTCNVIRLAFANWRHGHWKI